MSNSDTHPSPAGRLLAILICLPAARLLFHLIHQPDLEPHTVLAIGLPAAAAFVLAVVAPAPQSATGRLVKGITLLILVAWGLFSLSAAAVLTVSPLFYASSVIIGLALDTHQRTAAFHVTQPEPEPAPADPPGSFRQVLP